MADEPARPSYVNFYPSDWRGGTAHLTPMLEWTYFQICLHNWDKGRPMTPAMMPLMLGRNPDWKADLATLIEMDKVVEAAGGAVMVPRAIASFEAAAEAVEKKRANGMKGAAQRWKKDAAPKPQSDDPPPGDLAFSVSATVWAEFKEYRERIKHPLTARSSKAILKKLEQYQREHGDEPEQVIRQTIDREWRDVFPLRKNGERYGSRRNNLTLFSASRE